MNPIFILFRDDEFAHGSRDVVGWFSNESSAREAAREMEWADFHRESLEDLKGSVLLSPDQTEYRRYTVEPANQLG